MPATTNQINHIYHCISEVSKPPKFNQQRIQISLSRGPVGKTRVPRLSRWSLVQIGIKLAHPPAYTGLIV